MAIEVTITSTLPANASGVYVIIGETEYRSTTSGLTVEPGDKLTFSTKGNGGSVSIDGTTVLSTTSTQSQTYTWGVPSGISSISIDISATGSGFTAVGTIVVTTEKIPEPAKTHRTLIEGVGFSISAGRCLVGGVGYSIQKGRTLVGGVGYDVAFGPSGPVAGDVTVGSSVWANVNGVRTEFLVVHQGIPDASVYDASCDGTWVLMKDCYTKMAWHSSVNIYESSDIHSYLNSTFLGLFDSGIKARIKTAKIPYQKGGGSGGTLQQGANGLSTQIFHLSSKEVDGSKEYYSGEGVALSYFAGCTDSKRIAYLSGTTIDWWLRSVVTSSTSQSGYVKKSGGATAAGTKNSFGVRPAFILDSSAAIDPNTFDIIG